MTELLRAFPIPIHNPYWTDVREHVSQGDFPWETPCVARYRLGDLRGGVDWDYLDRHNYVMRYAWCITDPGSVQFVAAYSRMSLLDPMAGSGYWGYVLKQLGVDVVSYDAAPGTNPWHHDHALWVPVNQGYAEVTVDKHPDRVLFLSWPPYSEPSAYRTLREYKGDRLIYIGEGESGCTADEDFHDLLAKEWHEIASHRPIQWWGLHDDITVYERGPWKDTDEDPGRAAEPVAYRAEANRLHPSRAGTSIWYRDCHHLPPIGR
jgi:hypothetical protein